MTPEQARRLAEALRQAAAVLDEVGGAGEGARAPAPRPKRRREVRPPPLEVPVPDTVVAKARRWLRERE